MNAEQVKQALHDLQVWFASKPYGWRERATPGQLQQWTDREREERNLLASLERMEAAK